MSSSISNSAPPMTLANCLYFERISRSFSYNLLPLTGHAHHWNLTCKNVNFTCAPSSIASVETPLIVHSLSFKDTAWRCAGGKAIWRSVA